MCLDSDIFLDGISPSHLNPHQKTDKDDQTIIKVFVFCRMQPLDIQKSKGSFEGLGFEIILYTLYLLQLGWARVGRCQRHVPHM